MSNASSSEHEIKQHRGLPAAAEPYKWKPGQSGNPGGRPKKDKASDISVKIFEENAEAIEKAMLAALKKGDARVFQVLADRGYGKLREEVEHTGDVGVHVTDRLLSARKRTRSGDAEIQQDDRERE